MKTIALDAGHSRFTLAEGTYAGREVQLHRVFSVDIPTGSVADGIIADITAVRSAMAPVVKANKLVGRPAVITVNSNSMIMRRVEVPNARDKDLPALVDMEMRQFLPTGRPFVVDYVTLGESTSAHGGKMLAVKAAAMPAELCEGYFRLCGELGIRPQQLDVQQQVLGRLFAPPVRINTREIGNKAIIAVELAHFQTMLTVVINGEVDLSRTMPVGIANLERMVADRMQITPEEARTQLRKTMDLHRDNTDAVDAARRFFGQIIAELRKVQQYIRAKNITEQTQVYLYGVGAGLNGLDAYMTENLELDTETILQHNRIHMPPDDRVSPLAQYLNAAGALLKA